MLIFLPIMLFSNAQEIPNNSQQINVPIIPNALPIMLKLNRLKSIIIMIHNEALS